MWVDIFNVHDVIRISRTIFFEFFFNLEIVLHFMDCIFREITSILISSKLLYKSRSSIVSVSRII